MKNAEIQSNLRGEVHPKVIHTLQFLNSEIKGVRAEVLELARQLDQMADILAQLMMVDTNMRQSTVEALKKKREGGVEVKSEAIINGQTE